MGIFRWPWLVMAVLAISALANPAQADQFGLYFGSGGYGHGHGYHHSCWQPGWGVQYGGWYPPPPRYVYVEPAPVIRERVYVQPSVIQERVIVQPPAPAYTPSYTSPPQVSQFPAPPNRDTVDAPVIIRNSAGKNVPVAFLVDSKDEELTEGQARTFSGSGKRVIEFDRGGDRGTARYELTGGLYSFTVTSNGWDLVRETGVPQTAKRPVLRRNEIPGEIKLR